jgi:DNA-binding CsgD family transcriptional regulator
MEPLTTAELRALHALARYETATEAAKAAGLSPQTLRNQAHHAFQKLGVKGRTEAFRKIGWLRPPRFMPSAEDPDPFRSPFDEAPRNKAPIEIA